MRAFFMVSLLFLAVESHCELEAQIFMLGGDLIPSLIADQREPRLAGKLIGVTEGATLFGSGIEAEAGLGRVFPVLLLSGNPAGDYFALGMGAGVWGRFNMETRQKHLISSDWNFRLPFALRRGRVTVVGGYYHVSAHLGDEYADEFGAFRSGYSVDNIGGVVVLDATDEVQVYAGGMFAVNVQPSSFERWGARVGIQHRRVDLTDIAFGFAGLDVSFDQNAAWDPRLSFRSGVTLLPVTGNHFSLEFEFYSGPSPQREFLAEHETFVSLGLYVH